MTTYISTSEQYVRELEESSYLNMRQGGVDTMMQNEEKYNEDEEGLIYDHFPKSTNYESPSTYDNSIYVEDRSFNSSERYSGGNNSRKNRSNSEDQKSRYARFGNFLFNGTKNNTAKNDRSMSELLSNGLSDELEQAMRSVELQSENNAQSDSNANIGVLLDDFVNENESTYTNNSGPRLSSLSSNSNNNPPRKSFYDAMNSCMATISSNLELENDVREPFDIPNRRDSTGRMSFFGTVAVEPAIEEEEEEEQSSSAAAIGVRDGIAATEQMPATAAAAAGTQTNYSFGKIKSFLKSYLPSTMEAEEVAEDLALALTTQEKAHAISKDFNQFRELQEMMRGTGILTHAAAIQVLPEMIDDFHCNSDESSNSLNGTGCHAERGRKMFLKLRSFKLTKADDSSHGLKWKSKSSRSLGSKNDSFKCITLKYDDE